LENYRNSLQNAPIVTTVYPSTLHLS